MDRNEIRYNVEPNCLENCLECLDSDLTSSEIHDMFMTEPIWRLTRYNFAGIPKTILRDNMHREEAFKVLSIMRQVSSD